MLDWVFQAIRFRFQLYGKQNGIAPFWLKNLLEQFLSGFKVGDGILSGLFIHG